MIESVDESGDGVLDFKDHRHLQVSRRTHAARPPGHQPLALFTSKRRSLLRRSKSE